METMSSTFAARARWLNADASLPHERVEPGGSEQRFVIRKWFLRRFCRPVYVIPTEGANTYRAAFRRLRGPRVTTREAAPALHNTQEEQ